MRNDTTSNHAKGGLLHARLCKQILAEDTFCISKLLTPGPPADLGVQTLSHVTRHFYSN
jgi:hypothetical protein